MSNRTKDFLDLVKNNPNLPIVPFTYYEVIADDGGYWLGEWEEAKVDSYLIWNERTYYKSDIEELYREYEEERWEEFFEYQSETQKKKYINDKFQGYWTEAIIVYIGLPDAKESSC